MLLHSFVRRPRCVCAIIPLDACGCHSHKVLVWSNVARLPPPLGVNNISTKQAAAPWYLSLFLLSGYMPQGHKLFISKSVCCRFLARQKAALSAAPPAQPSPVLSCSAYAIKAIKAAVKFVKGFYVNQRRDYNCFMRTLLAAVAVSNKLLAHKWSGCREVRGWRRMEE